MIKKLKWKFVAISMALVCAVLLAVFGTVLLMTRSSLERISNEALNRALQEGSSSFQAPGNGGGGAIPTFTVTIDESNTIYVTSNRFFKLDNDTLVAVCGECLDRGTQSGVLEKYGLRFLRADGDNATEIAFADLTYERGVLRGLLTTSAYVGGGAILILFTLCVLLSSLAVRPAQQAWDRQRSFVADASHELNTPLTVIISNVGLLAQQTQGTAQEERVERVKYEAERMKSLTGDLLSLARLDNPDRKLIRSEVNLSDIAYQSVLLFEPVFFDEGKEVRSHIEKDVRMIGDESQLKQLLEILLDNARKYGDAAMPVDVSVASLGKKKAALTVRNFGEVIPKEKLQHLFERFYRTDEARTQGGGYGLGLAIAKGIAQSHGGTIRADSDAANGTVFTVTLPTA
ncbi:MAG: HAMP domain-containing sensor histidine kinase [Oscillospiraceae bacterium]|nr:HAMP domain-containing sensor histidine kinase [Oscillospiraceae bacterium]